VAEKQKPGELAGSRPVYRLALGLNYVRLYLGRSGSGVLRGEGVRGIRYGVLGLDLGELGERPVKCFFTYPEDWRSYCATDVQFNRQWDLFLGKWRQRWGEPVGYWVKEFQNRGAPHMNWVAQWPETADGYEELRARTLRLAKAEGGGDIYRARGTKELLAGDFGWWIRTAWAEVVTGNDGSSEARKHQARGVECRVNYWSERAEEFADRARVAWYVARDIGKERQKTAPEGWGRVRPWWGAVNMRSEPATVEEVSYFVFVRLRSRLEAWCLGNGVTVPNVLSLAGITAPGMRGEEGVALLVEVEEELRRDDLLGA